MNNPLMGITKKEQLVQYWLLLLMILLPVWMGGTGAYARLFLSFSGMLFPLVLIQSGKKLYLPPGMLPLSLFCGWLIFQILPLPPFVLHLLSPGYSAHLDQGFWLLSPEIWRPLSLNPSATLHEFFRYVGYAGFYLAATNLFTSFIYLRRLLNYLTLFVGCYAFLGLVQFFQPGEKVFWFFADWPNRTSHHFASFVNGNHYASLIGMVFPLLVICTLITVPSAGYGRFRDRFMEMFTDNQLSLGILFCVITPLAMVSVFFSLSRGGTLSLIGSSVVLLALLIADRNLQGKMLTFVLVITFSVVLFGFFGWDPLMNRFSNTFYETGGLKDQRLIYWIDSIQLFLAAPLTGSGAGTFVDAYPLWQTAETNGLIVDHAHNDYVELLTNLGLVGVGLVFWFWASLFLAAIPALKKRRNKLARLASIGAISGLVAILLHSFTDFNLAIPVNGLYLFLLFSIFVAASHSSSKGRKCELPELTVNWRRFSTVFLSIAILALSIISIGELVSFNKFVEIAQINLSEASTEQLDLLDANRSIAERFSPLNPAYPLTRGMTSSSLGQLDSSLNHLIKCLKLQPFNRDALLQSARILAAKGDSVKAEKVLRGALATAVFDWNVRMELVDFLMAQGRQAEGFLSLQSGLTLKPSQTSKVLQRLVLHGIERKSMVKALPEISLPWSIYGDFMQDMGDLGAAEQAYRHGMQVVALEDPPNSRVFWRYLVLLNRSKRNAEALELLRRALDFFPENQHFLARQGVLYEREGLRDRAIESYRSSILLDPKLDWVRKRLERLRGE